MTRIIITIIEFTKKWFYLIRNKFIVIIPPHEYNNARNIFFPSVRRALVAHYSWRRKSAFIDRHSRWIQCSDELIEVRISSLPPAFYINMKLSPAYRWHVWRTSHSWRAIRFCRRVLAGEGISITRYHWRNVYRLIDRIVSAICLFWGIRRSMAVVVVVVVKNRVASPADLAKVGALHFDLELDVYCVCTPILFLLATRSACRHYWNGSICIDYTCR